MACGDCSDGDVGWVVCMGRDDTVAVVVMPVVMVVVD